MQTRFAPTLSLFVLAPLIAEYLLGSLPVAMIAVLPIMAAMYGSAALLIREIAQRTGGGWTMTTLLGLAYGLIEEGLADQSLFNPHYLHLRLLDYGYVPALGTGLPWLVYVLTIHVAWSICVPIALAEALFPARRAQSWLGPVATTIFSLLFVAGMLATTGYTRRMEHFTASPGQLIGAAVAVVVTIAAALALSRRRSAPADRKGATAWLVLVVTFLAGSGVMASTRLGLPWPACVVAQLAIVAGFALFAARAIGDGAGQRLAFVTGGLAVYALFGVFTDLALHGPADLPLHAVVILLFAVLAAIAARRTLREQAVSPTGPNKPASHP